MIPLGWEKRNHSEISNVKETGKKLIEKSTQEKLPDEDLETTQAVLYLKSGNWNRFTSDLKPLDESSLANYKEVQKYEFDIFEKAYRDNGLKIKTRRGEESIDGFRFSTLQIELYEDDFETLRAKSELFDARIGQYSFLMSYTCVEEEKRQAILEAIRESKFRPNS